MPRNNHEGNLFPVLPAEVLLDVFDHLGSYDLLSVALANSAMSALARPLRYRFARFDPRDLAFPLAPNPSPFFRTGDATVDIETEEQKRIIDGVKVISLSPHNPRDCQCHCRCATTRHDVSVAPTVVCIKLPRKVRGRNGLKLGRLLHPGAAPAHICAHLTQCMCIDCRRGRVDFSKFCGYARELFRLVERGPPVQTLVLHGVILAPTPISPTTPGERIAQVFRSTRNHVQVLASGFPWIPNLRLHAKHHCYSRAPCNHLPQGAESLTLIFWPGSSTESGVWVPPCGRWYDADENLDPMSYQTHICWLQTTIWSFLAHRLVYAKRCPKRLTVVNAAAVPPPNVSVSQHIAALEAGNASHTTIRDFFLDTYDAHLQRRTEPGHVLAKDDVRFLSLEDWLEEAEWQEVFSPAEISDYFSVTAAGKPMSERRAQYVRFAASLGLQPSVGPA